MNGIIITCLAVLGASQALPANYRTSVQHPFYPYGKINNNGQLFGSESSAVARSGYSGSSGASASAFAGPLATYTFGSQLNARVLSDDGEMIMLEPIVINEPVQVFYEVVDELSGETSQMPGMQMTSESDQRIVENREVNRRFEKNTASLQKNTINQMVQNVLRKNLHKYFNTNVNSVVEEIHNPHVENELVTEIRNQVQPVEVISKKVVNSEVVNEEVQPVKILLDTVEERPVETLPLETVVVSDDERDLPTVRNQAVVQQVRQVDGGVFEPEPAPFVFQERPDVVGQTQVVNEPADVVTEQLVIIPGQNEDLEMVLNEREENERVKQNKDINLSKQVNTYSVQKNTANKRIDNLHTDTTYLVSNTNFNNEVFKRHEPTVEEEKITVIKSQVVPKELIYKTLTKSAVINKEVRPTVSESRRFITSPVQTLPKQTQSLGEDVETIPTVRNQVIVHPVKVIDNRNAQGLYTGSSFGARRGAVSQYSSGSGSSFGASSQGSASSSTFATGRSSSVPARNTFSTAFAGRYINQPHVSTQTNY